jgi:2-polyprenyl-6-methoxyphenol hydroxylase-like FAD-dependent oxidoreductase
MGAVGTRRWGRVLVIGNSIAGLLAARALADYAERVTLIDRDRIPDEPRHRAGVPQGRHIHVVLTAGQRAMEALLPGVLEELAALDVPAVGMPRDIIQRNRGQWVRRWPESLSFLTGTRALVEHVVRRRVLAHERIDAIESLEAVGLDGDRRRVRGVRLRLRGGSPDEQTITGDLVVDASGRGSRTAQWLTSIGARPPAQERIETGLAYATRRYRATVDTAVAEYLGIYLLPRPGAGSGAVVMPIEERGTYLVTLTGLPGDEPPTDPAGFEAFTARLEHPIVHEWLVAAQADGPPLGYRSTANIRRRYDRLSGPDGLLVVGDAATSFNPVYGQGISVAALGAQALARALAVGQPTTRRLQRVVIDAGEQAWQISTGVDKALPTATGNAVRSGPLDRAAGWYLGRVQDHAASDMLVGNAFRDVVHLVAPVASLLRGRVARTVLLGRPRPGPAQPPLHPERS